MKHQHDPAVTVYAYRATACRHRMIDAIGLWYCFDDQMGCLDALENLPAGSTVRIEGDPGGLHDAFASPLKTWRY